jgi:hypothetical protein
MAVRFLISTLQPDADPAAYERWVLARDYPLVRSLPNYLDYRVHRIRTPILGAEDAGWQYLERIEVRSLASHDADLASAAGTALREELYGQFLDRSKNIYFATDPIE